MFAPPPLGQQTDGRRRRWVSGRTDATVEGNNQSLTGSKRSLHKNILWQTASTIFAVLFTGCLSVYPSVRPSSQQLQCFPSTIFAVLFTGCLSVCLSVCLSILQYVHLVNNCSVFLQPSFRSSFVPSVSPSFGISVHIFSQIWRYANRFVCLLLLGKSARMRLQLRPFLFLRLFVCLSVRLSFMFVRTRHTLAKIKNVKKYVSRFWHVISKGVIAIIALRYLDLLFAGQRFESWPFHISERPFRCDEYAVLRVAPLPHTSLPTSTNAHSSVTSARSSVMKEIFLASDRQPFGHKCARPLKVVFLDGVQKFFTPLNCLRERC